MGRGKEVKWFRVHFGGIIRNGIIYQQTQFFYGNLYKSLGIDSGHPEVGNKFELCLPYLFVFYNQIVFPQSVRYRCRNLALLYHLCNIQQLWGGLIVSVVKLRMSCEPGHRSKTLGKILVLQLKLFSRHVICFQA